MMGGMAIALLIGVLVNGVCFWLANQYGRTFSRKIWTGVFILLCSSVAVVLVDAWGLQSHIWGGGYYGFPVFGFMIAISIISIGVFVVLGVAIYHFMHQPLK